MRSNHLRAARKNVIACAAWLAATTAGAVALGQPAGENGAAPGAPAAPAAAEAAAATPAPEATATAELPSVTDQDAQPTAPAAPTGHPVQGGEYRTVNGHEFITPLIATSAFLNGSIAFAQGFGTFTIKNVPSILEGGTRDASLFLYNQQFLGQIGIANRVAIDLSAGGLAAVGGDLDTLLVLGGLALLDVGGMPKVRILTLDDVGLQLSAGVGVYYRRYLAIQPIRLLGLATGDLRGQEANIIQQADEIDVLPTLMVAEGIGPLGLQLSAAPQLGFADGGNSTAIEIGAHLAFDIQKLTDVVPVALTFEYGMDAGLDQGATQDSTFGGGFYYTGRRDFELGIAAFITPSEESSLINGDLILHYFF